MPTTCLLDDALSRVLAAGSYGANESPRRELVLTVMHAADEPP